MPKPPPVAIEGLAEDFAAGALIEAHVHPAHQVVHAASGVMRVRTADATWIVPPAHGLWMPAGVEHEIHCVSAVRMRTVYLAGEHRSFPRGVQVTGVSSLMRELLVRIAEGAAATQVPHLTALLIDEIAARDIEPLKLPRPKDRKIARLAMALRDRPADRTTLESWAARLGLSRRTLIRRVQDETGMTFRQLRRQARILAALERLCLGHPVTTVAFDVGFDSLSAFIQAFRGITGRTPGQYLKSLAVRA